jgi:hypothetical protein
MLFTLDQINSGVFYNKFHLPFKSWYCEYSNHVRIHDYVNIMINNFPIFVIRRIDNPHSENENMDRYYMIAILGFTKIVTK